MQVTMFVVFLATLALAALLAQSRARAVAVELTDKPFLTEPLAMRYPKGWDVRQESDEAPVRVIEPKRRADSDPRTIVLHQVAVPPSITSEQLFQRQFGEEWREEVRLQDFPLLGQHGVAARLDHYEQVSDTEIHVIPRWCAATVIPAAGPSGQGLGVVLEVRGPGVTGPAGLRLLRRVADGLSLRRRPGVEQ